LVLAVGDFQFRLVAADVVKLLTGQVANTHRVFKTVVTSSGKDILREKEQRGEPFTNQIKEQKNSRTYIASSQLLEITQALKLRSVDDLNIRKNERQGNLKK
jgi:hypothetical protein